ncbi:sigma-70 family RNA polymerase sigma factor [Candidatus Chlorohelix sp.]|uniref:RNA polymerase sigma factor n=1 Tax=Candidatus Chlorohelix sp. TaxID=3139201 RepID=UPI00304CEE67
MRKISVEAELVAKAKAGEVAAFERIVMEYEPKLSRFIYGLVNERELSEDLVQETFVSAYRALPSMPADLKLSAWLYKIALNKVRSEKRKKRPVPWLPLPFFGQNNDEVVPALELPDQSADTAETIAKRDAIMGVLKKLPPDQSAALLMDTQGFDDDEIADALDCSIGAVRQKLFRARKAFKALYEDN